MFNKQRLIESMKAGLIAVVSSLVVIIIERFSLSEYANIAWYHKINIFYNTEWSSLLTLVNIFILAFLLNFIGVPLYHIGTRFIGKTGAIMEDVETVIEKRIDVKEHEYIDGDKESIDILKTEYKKMNGGCKNNDERN